ncbi:MAG: MerR family transcriptional regulator [Corynebacterium sp.]|nr:MerR family transcriptional regulator [Corynebacterium sp.]
MRISEVARAAGCSVRAIRHYHAVGAVPEPPRNPNGYRDYTITDIAAVLKVRALVNAGVPLADTINPTKTLIDAALAQLNERIRDLRQQRRILMHYQQHGLGLPEDIRSSLIELGGDFQFFHHELAAWELMALCGIATEQTWERIRANLTHPELRASTIQTYKLWEQLGDASPNDTELINSFLTSFQEGIMTGIHETLQPGDLPLTVDDVDCRGAQYIALQAIQ